VLLAGVGIFVGVFESQAIRHHDSVRRLVGLLGG
jgi:hypothetical protein